MFLALEEKKATNEKKIKKLSLKKDRIIRKKEKEKKNKIYKKRITREDKIQERN